MLASTTAPRRKQPARSLFPSQLEVCDRKEGAVTGLFRPPHVTGAAEGPPGELFVAFVRSCRSFFPNTEYGQRNHKADRKLPTREADTFLWRDASYV